MIHSMSKEIEIKTKRAFRLPYYPHWLDAFTNLLKSVFGEASKHSVFGDFKPLQMDDHPAFFIHVIEKQ